MDVEFVYFDVDDTLLDHSYAERQALSDLRERYLEIFGTLSVDELLNQYRSINEPLWRRYAAGDIEKSTVQQERFEKLLESVGAPHANVALVRRSYMQAYGRNWRFVSGARSAYEQVSDHLPVGVMTNGFKEVQAEKLETFPVIEERAEAVVVCEDVGTLKPDPEVFARATKQAGVNRDAVLYVGDSYRSDVIGAQNAGWRVAWYAPDGTDGRSTDERGFEFSDWEALSGRLLP